MDNQDQAEAITQTEPAGAGPAPGLAETAVQVGAQLAALREQRGMSIEDVSARLKVSAQKLKRLEAGEWSTLPEMPFVQGVVRGYARMLGADPAPLTEPLRRFGRNAQIEMPPPVPNAPSIPKSPVRFRSPVGSPQAKWPWALAVLVIVAGATWYFGGSHKAASTVSPAEPASSASTPAAQAAEPASQPVVADVNATPPGADAGTVASDAAAANSTGAAMIAATDPSRVVSAVASAAAGMSAEASAPAAMAPASSAAAGQPGNGKLTLNLKADSWVEVRQRDGKIVFSQLLRAGAAQDITGDAPLKVVIGNVAGVESVQFNGQPVELKTRNAGNVARLSLQ
ncbi:Cytoskeleton protein RodZ [Pandoraea terrae]|uniref:Cytoskeleton protein RodZ n=1 Tax=Pandoraea terrae TaxID=1537710 RepID=A0A5E4UEG9_9BURK|nr:RodZ domain-containing protein [Pandoraea terrae]VVD98410.1 Cytoskeleton protein RodZ [Pandoraea terrae]